ncbi:MAG: GGDEF domain-containing protein [Wenzhouxiangellaceae bacterium]|nr:GGDEF domain-containing protein [Wenzhouxiangellaceae bacterium]
MLTICMAAGLAFALQRTTLHESRDIRSLRMWLTALSVQAAFWLSYLAVAALPAVVAIVVVNTLALLALVEYARALREFLGRPDRRRQLYLLVILAATVNLGFGTVRPDYGARVLAISLPGAAVLLWLAWTIVRHSSPDVLRSGRITTVVLAVTAASMLMRALETVVDPATSFAASWIEQIALMTYALFPVFASLGFLLMQTSRAQERLAARANTDDLTGALSRRAFLNMARHTLAGCRRARRPASLLLLDLDRFKRVNDTYGHEAGDIALCAFHGWLCELLRAEDVIGRIGGEEFVALLPGSNQANAALVAERIQVATRTTPVEFEDHRIGMTVSIGVAEWDGEALEIEPIVRAADKAMYKAKRLGRDRIVSVHSAEEGTPASSAVAPAGDETAAQPGLSR